MKNKQYMLFGWPDYEASGGMNDFIDSFDTITEAIKKMENMKSDEDSEMYWFNKFEIYDIINCKKIREFCF